MKAGQIRGVISLYGQAAQSTIAWNGTLWGVDALGRVAPFAPWIKVEGAAHTCVFLWRS